MFSFGMIFWGTFLQFLQFFRSIFSMTYVIFTISMSWFWEWWWILLLLEQLFVLIVLIIWTLSHSSLRHFFLVCVISFFMYRALRAPLVVIHLSKAVKAAVAESTCRLPPASAGEGADVLACCDRNWGTLWVVATAETASAFCPAGRLSGHRMVELMCGRVVCRHNLVYADENIRQCYFRLRLRSTSPRFIQCVDQLLGLAHHSGCGGTIRR